MRYKKVKRRYKINLLKSLKRKSNIKVLYKKLKPKSAKKVALAY